MLGKSRADFDDARARLLPHRGRNAELRRLFHQSPIPMTWIDDERRRLDANPAARLFLRRPLAELQGRSADDLLGPDQQDEADRQWAILREEGAVAGTMPIVAPDGQALDVDYCGVADLMPGAHLIIWMPSEWSDGELASADRADRESPSGRRLTTREREVLSLLATGATLEEIAERLTVARSTVKTHLRNALLRLGARHRAHALAIAVRDGEIDLSG